MLYDGRGEPIVIQSDPGLVCPYCKYDNTPALGGEAPAQCEGCGADLS